MMHFRFTPARKSKNAELSKRQLRILFLYVLPYSFLIVGGALATWGIRDLMRAKDSADWPSVEGKIISSSVERQSGNKGGTTYHAEIEYKFAVEGIMHYGERVAYGDYGSSDSSHARGIVERYPKNKVVTVYYMPDNPDVCVLETGVQGQAWTVPIFGSVFFIVGCAMAIGLRIAMRRPATRDVFY